MTRGHTAPIHRMMQRQTVDKHGCWLWDGAVNGDGESFGGYGQIRDTIKRATLFVHRVSYEHFVGPIPAGFVVDHLCHDETCHENARCRHRRCWNPDHLEAKSVGENTARGNSPNAIAVRKGVCSRGHERTPENLIVLVRKTGTLHSQCRPCFNEGARRRRREQRELLKAG